MSSSWWSRVTGSGRNDGKSFEWTDEIARAVQSCLHKPSDGGPHRMNVQASVTQRVDEVNSRHLRVETTYFGWLGVLGAWRTGVRRLPFVLKIWKEEEGFVARNPRVRATLGCLGSLHLADWLGSTTDGIFIELWLDRERFAAVEAALAIRQGPESPVLTLELTEPEEGDPSHREYSVTAYWLTTVPLDIGGARNHPFARESL